MIHLVTGGQRSGKSDFAEKLALSVSDKPIYLATSRIWDEGHRLRIEKHKERRKKNWTSVEEEKEISKYNFDNKTVLLDCITLWLTNFFFDNKQDIDKSLLEAKKEFDALIKQNINLIIVTNEIGLGGHPESEMAMKFADLQGYMNQYIASKADKMTMIISGIPLTIK